MSICGIQNAVIQLPRGGKQVCSHQSNSLSDLFEHLALSMALKRLP